MKPLNPIMAALLAASSATFALPRTAYAADAATAEEAAHEKALRDLDFVLPRLISLVGHDIQARKDIGERLARFVQGHDADKQYLTDDLLKDKVALPAAVAVAKDWPEKNKDAPGKVAVLYFVVGPESGPLPAWAPKEFKDRFTPGMAWSDRLTIALKAAQWSGTNRVAASGAADGIIAFLNDAADRAQKIVDDRLTKDEHRKSAKDNDTTGSKPPITGSGTVLDTAGSGFGFDDLYVTGARTMDLYGPNDDGFRTISVKITSKKDDAGNVINQIGITDITKGDSNSPSATQYVNMGTTGDTTIQTRRGGRSYVVSVGSDGKVTVKRGEAGGAGGPALETSLSELVGLRNDQIRGSGKVTIGDQTYYALGQGGAKGSFLFFAKNALDANPRGDAHPAMLADVAQVIGDGSTAPIQGKPDLGTDPSGNPYHLEFRKGLWVVVAGEGDKPKAAATTAATPPGGAPTDTKSPDAPNKPGASTLDQVIGLISIAKDKWEVSPGNAGFNAATKAKIRIVKHWEKGPTVYTIYFAPGLDTPPSIDIPPSVGEGESLQPLTGVRGFADYVVFEYTHSKQYIAIGNFLKWAKREKVDFDMSMDPRVGMQNVTSVDMALDMLTHYFDIKDEDRAKLLDAKDGLRARVTARADGKDYVLSGKADQVYFAQGAKGLTIWPKVILPGDEGTNEKMTGLRGPGTTVELVGGGPSEFQDKMTISPGHVSQLVKKQAHVAIYTGEDVEFNSKGEGTKAVLWYLMLDYKKNGVPARTKAIPVFGGHDRFALPAQYDMQGLEGVDLPDTAQLAMLHDSTAEKGAIVAYRTTLPDSQDGQNVQDKPGNCGGPVIWWGGETKEQAQKACEGDSKVH